MRSEREEIAHYIFDELVETGKFNGPINDIGKSTMGNRSYYAITLMIARYWDVYIQVWGPRSFYLKARGPVGNFNEKYKSADELINRIKDAI